MPRDPFAGSEAGPEPPFPIKLSGRIIKGFGRGSKELGIPTANIPISGLDLDGHTDISSGVYFGFTGLSLSTSTPNSSLAPNPSDPSDQQKANPVRNPSLPSTLPLPSSPDIQIHPAVLSIGYNPFYANTVRSVEVHILHKFDKDFYNALMNLSILGFIREEKNYESLEALVEDINVDIEVARRSLEREGWRGYSGDEWLTRFGWVGKEGREEREDGD